MTWRERIAEARELGYFTPRGLAAWVAIETCPAAETALAYGVGRQTGASRCPLPFYNSDLHSLGDRMWDLMIAQDFDGCDRLLDRIEDRALQLKREATS